MTKQKRPPCRQAGEGVFCLRRGDRLAVKDAGTTPPKRQFEPGSLHPRYPVGPSLRNSDEPVSLTPGLGPKAIDWSEYIDCSSIARARAISTTCRIGPAMNILSRDKQIEIIAALTEGMSIRASRAPDRRSPRHDHAPWRSRRPRLRRTARSHDGRRSRRPFGAGRAMGLSSARSRSASKRHEIFDKGDQYTFIALASRPRRSSPIAPASATARIRTNLCRTFASASLARLRSARTASPLHALDPRCLPQQRPWRHRKDAVGNRSSQGRRAPLQPVRRSSGKP